NFVLAADVLARRDPLAVRYALAAAHYRSSLDVGERAFDEAEAAVDRIRTFQERVARTLGFGGTLVAAELPEAFGAALDDDLGLPQALALVHETVRAGNAALDAGDRNAAARAANQVGRMTGILGLNPQDPQWRGAHTGGPETRALDALVQGLIAQRAEARANKDWASADRIRDAIRSEGRRVG